MPSSAKAPPFLCRGNKLFSKQKMAINDEFPSHVGSKLEYIDDKLKLLQLMRTVEKIVYNLVGGGIKI